MEDRTAHYTVLARRFRPQTFGEVVGQQHVARALKNAIHQGRVAHAYLFTGARGVGKTSMARILAKALNCPNAVDGEPCNQCEICQGISAGHDVDVLEIDGASNRGIDDIRQLRANVNVRSMRTRYKIYIIDEVHMLTKEAFNALLKTLEEPPPSVKFVFCTTEPNKVPDTILSRCQRFDFATIETQNIIVRLQEIAVADGFDVEPAAVELVARRAAGSMRDSQSLFDQLLAFGEDSITAADVHRLLGTADDDRLIQIIEALVERRRDTALQLLDRALGEGVQLGELVDQLLSYLRDLMVIAAGAETVALLSVSSENRDTLAGQAQRWGLQTIVAALEILTETKNRMFRASHGRAVVELGLVRISLLADLEQLGQVIQQLRSGGPVEMRRPAPAPNRPPVAAAPSQRPAESRSPAAPPAAAATTVPDANLQKKNGESPNGDAPVSPNRAETTTPATPLAPGAEWQVWSQITSRIRDMLSIHVQAVADVAISGPNGLELLFPTSYHFSRTYCERPEVISRLQKLAAEVTGSEVRITTRLVEGTVAPAVEQRAAAKPIARRPLEAGNDSFVQSALSVFGASIVKVDEVAASAASEE